MKNLETRRQNIKSWVIMHEVVSEKEKRRFIAKDSANNKFKFEKLYLLLLTRDTNIEFESVKRAGESHFTCTTSKSTVIHKIIQQNATNVIKRLINTDHLHPSYK